MSPESEGEWLSLSGDGEVLRFDGTEAKTLQGEIVEVYRSVFTQPPFDDSEREVGWFAEEFAGDVELAEFRRFSRRRGWVELGRGPLGWGRAERLVLGLEAQRARAARAALTMAPGTRSCSS